MFQTTNQYRKPLFFMGKSMVSGFDVPQETKPFNGPQRSQPSRPHCSPSLEIMVFIGESSQNGPTIQVSEIL